MRNLKKFLALVMAMVMALSLMVSANAAVTANKTYPDNGTADPAFEEAITVLSGMGVFSGDNGNFYPKRNVTRAEAAALVYRLATGDVNDTQANLYAKYGNFPDVTEDKWYAGYVGYCANKGLIKGRPDGTFDPTGSVTGYEILAMILRAVGYDQNGEFTGSDWQVNVSALSQKLGVIANVNTTQYGGTLYLPAERQVVADLLFQTDAYIPQVNYTTAFGYQYYGNEGGIAGSKVNETLGEKIFGLTWNNGVVVGNEVTGEAKGITKIGFSLESKSTSSILTGDWETVTGGAGYGGYIQTQQTSFATKIDNTLAIRKAPQVNGSDPFDSDENGTMAPYYGSAYVYASDTTNALPLNVTRSFKWDSNLYLFDHAVKVWFDYRSSQYETVGNGTNGTAQFTTNLNTYAVFDELKHDDHDGSRAIIATSTSVVSLGEQDADLGDVATRGNLGDAAVKDKATDADVSNNWAPPALKLRTMDIEGDTGLEYVAYANYSFGPTKPNGLVSNVPDSPVLKNSQDATAYYGLYLLIANGADKTLDVVIPLQMTFTKITQINNTTAPYSVGVFNGNAGDTDADGTREGGGQYFDTWDTVTSSNGDKYAVIAQDNLRNSPVTALNTKVAAIQITGTAPGDLTRQPKLDIGDDYNEGNAPLIANFDPGANGEVSTYYYQLTKNTLKKTYTVIAINPNNQTLTVKDASGNVTTLNQSVFAEATDGTFIPNDYPYLNNIEGVNKDVSPYDQVLKAGRDYEFTLDEQGHYIYWETKANTATFVYGTYIDFYSALASSQFSYPLVYVSENGDARQKENVTKVNNGAASNPITNPGTMSSLVYDSIQLPKRDTSDQLAGTSGYKKGFYVGYALDGNELTAIGPYVPGTISTYGNDQDTGFYQASATDFGAATYGVTPDNGVMVNKARATLGAVQIPSSDPNIDYFVTNNTQFYVVDGAGTENQTVAPYAGITALLGSHSSVVINVSTADSPLLTASKYLDDADGSQLAGTLPYEMVYYSFGRTDYAQDYLGSAYEITKVFVPKEALIFTDAEDTNLFFVGDKTQLNISSVGPDATQFTMFDKDGVEGKYWVEGYINDTMSSAKVINDNGHDVFYRLHDTGTKAVDGSPIYELRNADDADIIGQAYDGYTAATDTQSVSKVNVAPTGCTADGNDTYLYAATTTNAQVAYIDGTLASTSPLFNVGTAPAKVVNLNAGYPGITSLPTLNDAGSLTDNIGVPVSCVLQADSSVIVNVIFVDYVNTH